jgi:hypothetical protein
MRENARRPEQAAAFLRGKGEDSLYFSPMIGLWTQIHL